MLAIKCFQTYKNCTVLLNCDFQGFKSILLNESFFQPPQAAKS